MRQMNAFLAVIDWISEWEGKIVSFFFVIASVQVCFELTLRYVFNAPTTWGLELTIYLCAVTYVMGGAYAQRFNAHIQVDLFYIRWSPRTRAIVDLFIGDLLFFFFCGVLVWQSGAWAWNAFTKGMTSGTIWDPPIWPMKSVLFFGSLLLFLQGCSKFIRDLTTAFNKREET
jgi:TRAP-type mannitol/chloroaromatic compound transport system permease small subunit